VTLRIESALRSLESGLWGKVKLPRMSRRGDVLAVPGEEEGSMLGQVVVSAAGMTVIFTLFSLVIRG
jgi:hypothetical protein